MDGYIQALVRLGEAAAKIAELEAERDALRADAERYRWLRESGAKYGCIDWGIVGIDYQDVDGMDRAIDAAIAAKEPK